MYNQYILNKMLASYGKFISMRKSDYKLIILLVEFLPVARMYCTASRKLNHDKDQCYSLMAKNSRWLLFKWSLCL